MVVWTNETRPIRGAGSLDSLTRAALQNNRKKNSHRWCAGRAQNVENESTRGVVLFGIGDVGFAAPHSRNFK
jgi:hypothetical protein